MYHVPRWVLVPFVCTKAEQRQRPQFGHMRRHSNDINILTSGTNTEEPVI